PINDAPSRATVVLRLGRCIDPVLQAIDVFCFYSSVSPCEPAVNPLRRRSESPFSQRTHRNDCHAASVSTLRAEPENRPKVLVVDDEPPITDAGATALRYEGFETREAATGRIAEHEIDSFRPDLVVLDVMLPDLDGFAIAGVLGDGRQRVPIIFLTAKDGPEDKLEGLSLGDDYVTKPFSLAEMVARVRTVLRRTRAEQDAAVLEFADLV